DAAPGAAVAATDAAAASSPPAVDAAVAVVPPPPPPEVVAAPPRKLWTPRLDSEADFLAYSKELGGERFTKFVIDLKTDAVYYFDVDVYPIHKDFIFKELYRTERTKEANKRFDKNYGPNKTEFMMLYLTHHLSSDQWTLAFWEGDIVTAAHVTHAYKRMRETFYAGDKVLYRPDSTYQEKVALQLKGIPVITNDQLYKGAAYQVFNPGTAVGTLRVVPKGVDYEELTFSPDEVVILPESLPDITPVAGIVSETFSTPLSHVSLRARAWGVPDVGQKGATATYGALAGKVVWFEATGAGMTLREATPAEIAARDARAKAARTVLLPEADLTATDLRGLDALRATDVTAYGTKAANLGEVVHGKLPGFQVPPGFGVPIHYYDQHMKQHGFDRRVTALLADDRFRKDAAYRKAQLAKLRADIIAAPLDPAFAALLATRLGELTGGDAGRGVFVRSSTNAEDLPGFNGAGLYDTIPNVKGADAVGDAVKAVWASVWNLRAYEERELFQIDHTRVYGAVLVQIGIDATAAGVLVTVHPTDPSDKVTYTINAKSGLGLRVVEGQKVPESLLYDSHNHGLRVLSRSDEDTMLVFDARGGVREVPNPQKGKPILDNKRALILGTAATRLKSLFPTDRPLDLEWVFVGDDLYIVQTRPYVTH
ncbi:MAG TPA: PEP/pyruvate-binding domain-containing protein, partial [Kofleriaceae bacterium]|nr:PEP/pyruvate-binding domain-containing protein [Kofleriaceae bacterium]